MVSARAREALVPRRMTTAAVIAVVAAALGLYQATSLLLGPAAERQIALSLSTPSQLEEGPLPAVPAAQVLEVGQAVVGRVERGLAALPFALRPVQPPVGSPPGAAAADAAPSGPAHGPGTLSVVVPQPAIGRVPAAGHERPGVLPGSAHPAWPPLTGRSGWPTES